MLAKHARRGLVMALFCIVRTGCTCRTVPADEASLADRAVLLHGLKKNGSFDRLKRLDSMTHTQIRIDGARPTRVSSPDVTALQPSRPTAVTKNERKWRSRLTRWTMGGILLAAAGWLVVPSIMFRTSVRATVTAPLVDVRIPLQGVVCGSPPLVGTRVSAGEKLFEVQAAAPDRRPSEHIRGEIESIRRNATALKAQIVDLDKLKETLNVHFEEYKDARIAQAEKLVAEQDARVNETASRLKTAEFEHRMHTRLHSKGGSSEFELARAEFALEGVRNELEVARQATARLQHQLAAAHKGFFVGESDGGQERVASKQRVDEIEIQQAGLRAKLGELEGKLNELNLRLESEDQYLASHQMHSVVVADQRRCLVVRSGSRQRGQFRIDSAGDSRPESCDHRGHL